MEKTYYWEYDEYHFKLFIGDDGLIWDDEGVLQPVKLYVNGFEILNNNFGTQHNLEFLLKPRNKDNDFINNYSDVTLETYDNALSFATCNDYDKPNIIMSGNDYKEFKMWIKSCLAPKEERIKIKLYQLLENKKMEY